MDSSGAPSPAPAFSLALFRSLLEALDPSDVAIKIIVTIALSNLSSAPQIIDAIERRMYAAGLESLALRALWVVLDHVLKAAPLVYGRHAALCIPALVERRVPWESEDALRISFWMQRMVASWAGLLPAEVWRSVYEGVRQRRTQLMLADAGHAAREGGTAASPNGDDEESLLTAEGPAASHRIRAATQQQLDSLREAWAALVSMATEASDAAEGGSGADDGSPAAKRHRPEGGDGAAHTSDGAAAGGAEGGDASDEDFSLGDVDPTAQRFDANGNPIIALQEISLPVTARQPRRRR